MYCKNCGKEVSEKAIVCPGCGVPPLSEHNHCQHCGVPTQSNQVMCIKCGMSLVSDSGDMDIGSGREGSQMDTQKAMRICIVLSWIFGILSLLLYFVLQDSLPLGLQGWLLEEAERKPAVYEVVSFLVFAVLIVVNIVASVGLYLLKKWAARLYIFSLVIMVIMVPFFGPTVEEGIVTTFASIADIISGLVLGLAFFSDALNPKRQIAPTTL